MSRRKRAIVVVLLVVGILLTSFGGAAARQDKPKFFLIAHGGPGNSFWVTVIKGMTDAAALMDVDATWLGADTASNEAMVGFWDDALAAEPDGIGTTEPVPALIEDGVNRAVEAGIPVIAFNTQDTRPEGERLKHLFYIGSSEFLGGQEVARRFLAAGEIGAVLCPIQEVGHTGLEARCNGVESVMAEQGIEVIRFTINYNVPESAGLIADAFAANPEANAIVTLGPDPAASYYQYAEENAVDSTKVFHATFDTSPLIFEKVKAGVSLVSIDQQPYVQGFDTVVWLFLNSQYLLKPANDIFTGPNAIDASNVDRIIELNAAGYR
ncbi:MAG TPA: substrate-binding domain-containing protein [Aggregatilineaceae bacterium]|nr:substrate-binding domain-containing protein [Aggregatilineaceae bacterium]